MTDVVVIGGGLGGLECAALLARAGMSVVVLEQGAQVGGCLQCYKRGAEELDTGFHYVGALGDGQSLHAAFSYLGLMSLPWQKLDADGFDRVTMHGKTYAYAEGYDAFTRQMSDYFPAQRAAICKYVDLLRHSSDQQWEALRPNGQADTALTDKLLGTRAWQYLNETFSDPLLINVLSATALKMELRKESLPLFTFAHGASSYIESSWRLRGPGNLIAHTLAQGIEAQGGTVVCRAKVVRLVEREGRVCQAVCADGRIYDARWFVSDLSPSATCLLIAQSQKMRPAYRRRMATAESTMGMYTLSICMPKGALPYFNYNRYIYDCDDVWELPTHNSPVGGLLLSCRPSADGGGSASVVDLLTPMQWSQCQQWQDTTVGRRGQDYADMKQRVARECLRLASRHVPELHKAERMYASTPLTWRDYTLSSNGSAYGTRKDARLPLSVAMSPRTPVPNLLMTGQSLMLHGLHGVTMTSLHTCACLLGKQHIWNILNYKTI